MEEEEEKKNINVEKEEEEKEEDVCVCVCVVCVCVSPTSRLALTRSHHRGALAIELYQVLVCHRSRWNGTLVTTVFGRKRRAPLISRAL